jgi:hypothetical protein
MCAIGSPPGQRAGLVTCVGDAARPDADRAPVPKVAPHAAGERQGHPLGERQLPAVQFFVAAVTSTVMRLASRRGASSLSLITVVAGAMAYPPP